LVEEILDSDLIEQLEVLDLSLGTLSSKAQSLKLLSYVAKPTEDYLTSKRKYRNLRKLNIRHHYCPLEMIAKVQSVCPWLGINAKDCQGVFSDEEDNDSRLKPYLEE
jgi:hypothetical protein